MKASYIFLQRRFPYFGGNGYLDIPPTSLMVARQMLWELTKQQVIIAEPFLMHEYYADSLYFWQAFQNACHETTYPWQLRCDWKGVFGPQTLVYNKSAGLFFPLGKTLATYVVDQPVTVEAIVQQVYHTDYHVKLYAVERGTYRKIFFEK